MSQKTSNRWPLIGGVVAAVVASLCCVGPLVLVMLGIGGAWVSNLAVMEPLRPYFLGVAMIFLFLAWRKIYGATSVAACTPGSLCALPQTKLAYKIMFWIVAILIGLAIAFPYIDPMFY